MDECRALKIEKKGLLVAAQPFSKAIRAQWPLDHILFFHLPNNTARGVVYPFASSDADHIDLAASLGSGWADVEIHLMQELHPNPHSW